MDYPRHIVCVASLVRNQKREILLVETERRGWELPGGQVEEGEDLITALQREAEEEAGVAVKVLKLAAIYSSLADPAKLIIDFMADHVDGTPRPAYEISNAAWFSEQAALEKVANPLTVYRLKWLLTNPQHGRYVALSKDPFTVQTESHL